MKGLGFVVAVYSSEEICAELSASMVCAVAMISNETIELSASYTKGRGGGVRGKFSLPHHDQKPSWSRKRSYINQRQKTVTTCKT